MQFDMFAAAPAPGIETERRNRIRLSLAAYAYEIEDAPFLSDAEFDALASRITTNLCKLARWALNDETSELVNIGDVPSSLSGLAERVRRIAARVAVATEAEKHRANMF